jgi:small subunit ribosomal protein S6
VEATVDDLIVKLSEVVRELGGEIERVENLGRKDFVRVTVRGHEGDAYVRLDVVGPREIADQLQERLRLDKTVKRVMVEHRRPDPWVPPEE